MKKSLEHSFSPGYSIIAAIMMIGFLLVLTTSTLNLVLQEMQDGRGRQDYMKAYAGAEGAMELGLLQIKEEGYGYYNTLTDSSLLGSENKDAELSYSFSGRLNIFTSNLGPLQTDIIPLFWIDSIGDRKDISDPTLMTSPDVAWNILGEDGGVSGQGNISPSTPIGEKTFDGSLLDFDSTTTVSSFISGNNYLVVYNPTSIDKSYTLQVASGYFTKPRSAIFSRAKVGKYSQNIKTMVDNTEFLGILRYSIYSGD